MGSGGGRLTRSSTRPAESYASKCWLIRDQTCEECGWLKEIGWRYRHNITGPDYPERILQCELCHEIVTESQLTTAVEDRLCDIDYLIYLEEQDGNHPYPAEQA